MPVCLGYSREAALAQDLMQETFVKVWNNMQKFMGRRQSGISLFCIVEYCYGIILLYFRIVHCLNKIPEVIIKDIPH
ncbi:MAG: hypothetical protein DI539_19780 [Flavobacterium psychrophilum]|nr:MAG: hypothetical protein DI539_19780 [Flavobacterium psychrophilum]